ncbi:hypothetical protein RSOLAG1IB_09823 [Rhizoctonia solani AG-1 IB]|uniref:Uncharacterized protein n=1 Tax=Thanatephorus cucumeris (strain AG1-IB / isolate 7/3/14) TaxID=1108050 RepID=M5C3J5_THACB|nr:hypothetical protein BN14_07674 [Rhizoctonia solani AG-1 IB]CEL61181.1 hypothetical protein RSOLAG1IB_09823 [Rhizoctonia solani AG-1 IB]
MSCPRYLLAYFLNNQQLIDIYKEWGGDVGGFNVDSFDDIEHARRAIFQYLYPGPVRHWYATLDHDQGVVYMVGKTTRDVRNSMKRDLREKCKAMFKRIPNYCVPVPGLEGREWEMRFHDEPSRRLVLDEFMGSDKAGDLYPYYLDKAEPSPTQPQGDSHSTDISDPAPPAVKSPRPDYRLAYFLNNQQLIDIYKKWGGDVGNFDVDSFDDIEHARRAIFQYLYPGPVRHWYATLDHDQGVVYMVGKTTRDVRNSMKRDLREKCRAMFKRIPNYCVPVPGLEGREWEMRFPDEPSRRLVLDEFMGSDKAGDLYPYYVEGVETHAVQSENCGPAET